MSTFLAFAKIPLYVPDKILAGELSDAEVDRWKSVAQSAFTKYKAYHNTRVRDNRKRTREQN